MVETSKTTPISSPQGKSPQKGKKLLDQFRANIRLKQYSYRTEKAYIQWVREYILFHNKRHPHEMGVTEINQLKNLPVLPTPSYPPISRPQHPPLTTNP